MSPWASEMHLEIHLPFLIFWLRARLRVIVLVPELSLSGAVNHTDPLPSTASVWWAFRCQFLLSKSLLLWDTTGSYPWLASFCNTGQGRKSWLFTEQYIISLALGSRSVADSLVIVRAIRIFSSNSYLGTQHFYFRIPFAWPWERYRSGCLFLADVAV